VFIVKVEVDIFRLRLLIIFLRYADRRLNKNIAGSLLTDTTDSLGYKDCYEPLTLAASRVLDPVDDW